MVHSCYSEKRRDDEIRADTTVSERKEFPSLHNDSDIHTQSNDTETFRGGVEEGRETVELFQRLTAQLMASERRHGEHGEARMHKPGTKRSQERNSKLEKLAQASPKCGPERREGRAGSPLR